MIKEILINNLDDAYLLHQKCFNEKAYPKNVFAKVFNENHIVLGYYENNVLLSLMIASVGYDDVCIESVQTDNSYVQKGYATALINFVINYAKNKNKTISLEVSHLNEKAISLYKKCGFCVVNTRKKYYKNGSDALVMFYEDNN